MHASLTWRAPPAQRGAAPQRLPSPQLVTALRDAMRRPGEAPAPAAATDDHANAGAAPPDEDASEPLRFTVVETDRGRVAGCRHVVVRAF